MHAFQLRDAARRYVGVRCDEERVCFQKSPAITCIRTETYQRRHGVVAQLCKILDVSPVLCATYGFSQVSASIKKKPCCRSCYPGPTFSSATQHNECGQVYNIPPLRRCKGHQAGKHDVGSRTARNIKTIEVRPPYVRGRLCSTECWE